MLLWIALTSLIIMLVSLSGVVMIYSSAGNWLEDHLAFITSFAAGVFLVVSLHLLRHVLRTSTTTWRPLLFAGVGAALGYGLFRFIPFFHHHAHTTKSKDSKPSLKVHRVLFSDGLHNIGDGLLLAASFSVSTTAGIAAGIGVFVHEIVQEVSEFFVLKAAGLSTIRALTYNFLVSATILLGAFGGSSAIINQAGLRGPLLSIAAGSFLVVVVHDLIPHSFRDHENESGVWVHMLWFLGGLAIMATALTATA